VAEPTLAERVGGSPTLDRMRARAARLAPAAARVRASGLDSLPVRGPVVLAINHRHLVDGVLVFALVPRPVSCLVKAEAFTRLTGPVLRAAGQLPVVRQRVDPRPVRLGLAVLRGGGVLGVFPEGTRGDGLARTAKPGVGWFALRRGAAVVPVACCGTEHLRSGRRPLVLVRFGSALPFRRVPDRPLNRRVVADASERIRRALAALVVETDAARLEQAA
jgi:1-acyl-sn-glycerol-3-phosphate acyltransferase